jgi:serine/threonine-protein kinase
VKRAIPLGRYTLGERLGVGGMGEVYLAIASGLGGFEKPLALKLLLPHLSDKKPVVDRFLAEAHLAAKMSHVNVAHIFDVGTAEGRYFIAMELVRGVSLASLIKSQLKSGKHLPVGVVAYISRAVCDGLHHAHTLAGPDGKPLGVVHRDVTPHNILLSVDGAVKLTDFGIAGAAGVATSGSGLYGKAAYIAPELLRDGPFDRRADLFSLGVTLFHLGTLTSPFRRETQDETLSAVTDAPLPSLAALRPDFPPGLVAALERATAKDPAQRFDDARQMRDAMPAPPVDAPDQLSKLVSESFARDIEQLDAHTRQLVTSGAQKPVTQALSDRAAPPPQRRRNLAGLALVAASLVTFGIGLPFIVRGARQPEPAAPAPEAPPAAVTATPTPAPAVETVEAAAPAPREPAPAAPRRPHRAIAKAPPRASSSPTGYISIDATPWAEVRVDGKLIGETPIASFPVDADSRHEVELSNPDTKKQQRKMVKVAEGQRTFVKADLQ